MSLLTGSWMEDGMLIVPWSSRMARPEGVWRRGGRGLSMAVLVLALSVDGRGCNWIEGMVVFSVYCLDFGSVSFCTLFGGR